MHGKSEEVLMRLNSLWVDGYKNLLDVDIVFSSNEIPLAIIGNNGTGKSNLIEALLSIFIGLYFGRTPEFRFELSYEAHGKLVFLSNRDDPNELAVSVDGAYWTRSAFTRRIQKSSLMPPFPAVIFGYYSGTCTRLRAKFQRYTRSYIRKLKSSSDELDKIFNFSDVEQAKYILIAVLANSKNSLLHDLSIQSLNSLTITVRPGQNYDPNRDEPKFWGTRGALLAFFSDLDICARESSSLRTSAVESAEHHEYQRTYTLDQDGLEKLAESYAGKRGANIAIMLQALKAKSMLVSLKYSLNHIDGRSIFDFEALSEGEKQLISVVGGLQIIEKDECLVLLDEPDTHLNPTWTWRYASLLRDAVGAEQGDGSVVLIATHNPVLISGLVKEQVLIVHNSHGTLTYDHPYRDPRGQGVANVLTSEFFGLPSSLDEHTQKMIDERLVLAYKSGKLSKMESLRLGEINAYLDNLGLTISFRDPAYKKFEEESYGKGQNN